MEATAPFPCCTTVILRATLRQGTFKRGAQYFPARRRNIFEFLSTKPQRSAQIALLCCSAPAARCSSSFPIQGRLNSETPSNFLPWPVATLSLPAQTGCLAETESDGVSSRQHALHSDRKRGLNLQNDTPRTICRKARNEGRKKEEKKTCTLTLSDRFNSQATV